MQKLLELFIIETLESKEDEGHIEERPDGLLGEPHFVDSEDAEEKVEISAVGAVGGGGSSIRGVTTPLGTGPAYPNKGKKRKPAWKAASSGYGRAKPHKFQLNALNK